MKKRLAALAALLLLGPGAPAQAPGAAPGSTPLPLVLPRPQLRYLGTTYRTVREERFTFHTFEVINRQDYPAELFAPAPDLPPCGSNARASRTWIDFYEEGGRRLYGYCAIEIRAQLARITFGMPGDHGTRPRVYVEFQDRRTQTRYRSTRARNRRDMIRVASLSPARRADFDRFRDLFECRAFVLAELSVVREGAEYRRAGLEFLERTDSWLHESGVADPHELDEAAEMQFRSDLTQAGADAPENRSRLLDRIGTCLRTY